MYISFTNLVSMIFFQSIQMYAFPLISYDIHCISYGPIYMACIQYVVRLSRIAIVISDCLNMFFICDFKCSSFHFIWYTPLLSYLSVLVLCLNILVFFIALCTKSILSCVSLKILVTCLTSLPQYVKVAHFVFCFGSLCVLCFRDFDGTFSIRFVLY
jgi:hypothetical protein